MLAVIIAPSVGVDAATRAFAGSVILAATLGSIGIADVLDIASHRPIASTSVRNVAT